MKTKFTYIKRISIIVSLLISCLFSSAQITIEGKVTCTRNDCYNLLCLAAFIYNTDSVLVSKNIFHLGNLEQIKSFKLNVDTPGFYTLKVYGSFLGGNIYLKQDIKINYDTSIVIQLEPQFHYKQPCRMVFQQNGKKYNLPLDSIDIGEYKRIMRLSKKINLQRKKHKNYMVRLWEHGAFEYGGGKLYEIHNLADSITKCNVISFSSNYFDIMSKKNIEYKYESEDDIYINHLNYKILESKSYYLDKNFYNDLLILLNEFKETENYCIKMIQGDRHPAFDGVTYHFELNQSDNYSFTTFENPECVAEYYKQIAVFLEIKKLIQSSIKK